ncbi:MAG: thioredoxin fold domain-containing protein [Candidatus Aminicenantes bacterium]|nr:thioredoxin fold domain-containing protein [Candidatus Aminicenantes bacterium]NIM82789.1 thioredoxin fold domain-containing protein [Candidatus Aminicenantes bacterium]NIN22164.1 thioredoxin fold domain-containing protein [Candidatus Aminicenantes bacterium]NIN41161.1 thioredoxin fold domain-containing protein [Candidatus Aminicenantes bacterium]NIN88760.1 thioredoxin fold domain-containing protein [Candidatus Aminicenantes bacterium]
MNIRFVKMLKLFVLMLVSFQYFLFANITWETDWQKALKNAAANKQPVMMDFYTDWCPPCKRLTKTTFVDPKMINYFKKENYVLIKVNPEKDRAAENKFKVYSYPTLVIFNAKGNEIDRILGYQSTEELVKALEDLKKGIGTLEDLLNRYKKVKEKKTKETFGLMFRILDKYIARADYPDGLNLIGKIVEMDKDNAQKQASAALYQKGYIYYKWKKYKEAVNALLAIHKVYPDSREAFSGFAAAAYYSEKLNEPSLTLKILKDLVKRYPDNKNVERYKKKIEELEKKHKQETGRK